MSTAEILSLISTISFVVAGISAALAIFFWISFNIPSVIGDLSGRTARKSIARMRATNERAGGKGYRPSATNAGRGKLTDTMGHSKKLGAAKKAEPKPGAKLPETGRPETGLLDQNKAAAALTPQTDLLADAEATAPLADENATAPLVDEDATAPLIDEDATAPLIDQSYVPVRPAGGKRLQMLDEVILIHTNEVI